MAFNDGGVFGVARVDTEDAWVGRGRVCGHGSSCVQRGSLLMVRQIGRRQIGAGVAGEDKPQGSEDSALHYRRGCGDELQERWRAKLAATQRRKEGGSCGRGNLIANRGEKEYLIWRDTCVEAQ